MREFEDELGDLEVCVFHPIQFGAQPEEVALRVGGVGRVGEGGRGRGEWGGRERKGGWKR